MGISLAAKPDPIGVDGVVADHRREFAAVSVDARTAAIKARLLGVGTADLVLAVAAGALGQLMAGCGQPTVGRAVRAMVTRSLRAAGRSAGWRAAPGSAAPVSPEDGDFRGNWTTGVLLDLPIGSMSSGDHKGVSSALPCPSHAA